MFTPIKAQREAAASASRDDAARDRERINALQVAMQHRPTRAVLRWVLSLGDPEGFDLCPIGPTFNSNAMQMAHNEGVRFLKAQVWRELARHSPDGLALLLEEAKEP